MINKKLAVNTQDLFTAYISYKATGCLFVVFAPVYVVHIAACRQFLVERETAFQVLWRMTLDAHCQILFQQRLVVWVYAVVDDATCSLDR